MKASEELNTREKDFQKSRYERIIDELKWEINREKDKVKQLEDKMRNSGHQLQEAQEMQEGHYKRYYEQKLQMKDEEIARLERQIAREHDEVKNLRDENNELRRNKGKKSFFKGDEEDAERDLTSMYEKERYLIEAEKLRA